MPDALLFHAEDVEPEELIEPEVEELVVPVPLVPVVPVAEFAVEAEADALPVPEFEVVPSAAEPVEVAEPAVAEPEVAEPEADMSAFILVPVADPGDAFVLALADDPLLCDELQFASITASGNTINILFIIKKFLTSISLIK